MEQRGKTVNTHCVQEKGDNGPGRQATPPSSSLNVLYVLRKSYQHCSMRYALAKGMMFIFWRVGCCGKQHKRPSALLHE